MAKSSNHDARAVANVLISKAVAKGSPFTPLQIIKLSYISHGWMLGLHGKPLFRQPVLAWLYGPVVREIYSSIRHYRDGGVTDIINGFEEDFNSYESDINQQVFDKYGHLSGITLSKLTHATGTPWHKTWHSRGQNSEIPNDLIREHYAEKSRRAKSHEKT